MTWHIAAPAGELKDCGFKPVEVEGVELAIFFTDGKFYATSNICTHQHAYMSDGYFENGCIECPLHQAVFDVRTGEVVDGPTQIPLKTYPAKEEGDAIWVELT